MDRDKVRTARLNKVFSMILSGTTPINPHNGPLFLEALYTHPIPVDCIGRIAASDIGLSAFKSAIRYDLSVKFMNTHASAVLQYLQAPDLKAINNGDFLNSVLMNIVDPPIFWMEFRKAFLKGQLEESATLSFGWLLLHLCSLSSDQASLYREDNDMTIILNTLLSSPNPKLQGFGTKINEVLNTALPDTNIAVPGAGPGGRHDNDFPDFRKISILPTGEELGSKDPPFLRTSNVLEDPANESSRVAIHLDNQFRLLREDMIYEMREELQVATGAKKGRHRGTKIKGLKLQDFDCGDDRKRPMFGLVCVCSEDFQEMKKITEYQRRKVYLESNKRQFFKHQSMACLFAGKEIIGFPIINRDEDRLAMNPPEIVLQFENAESTQIALRRLKVEEDIVLIQIDTAVYAYEPVLKGLQQATTLPLSSELLLWKAGDILEEISEGAPSVVHTLRYNPQANLKNVLGTAIDIKLDTSQAASLVSGLTQKVSLIQGPPGTGKSFIGALIAKAIHDLTQRTILVVCYTNHALDDILTGLLDIGIPETSMLRLGGKSTTRTEPLTSANPDSHPPLPSRSQTEWSIIDELKGQLASLRRNVEHSFKRYMASSKAPSSDILDYLEIEGPEYFDAFRLPESEDGMSFVGENGKAAGPDYLINRWARGGDAGSFAKAFASSDIWNLPPEDRTLRWNSWKEALLLEAIQEVSANAEEYNRCCQRLNRAFRSATANILRSKRIVGCTTTAAAKYREEIQIFNPDVLLVEEAGEILESHVLTSLGPETSQMILIGDHKQLRPKVNHYLLTVEKGDGYDLNRSLFERLILKDYPHTSLSQQHRVRPEISSLIRHLTYPELIDAPKTKNRPNLLGVQDNIVFIHHEHLEDDDTHLAERREMASTSSKQNSFEVHMILKIVKYLAQQGYGTNQLVVLTPYLGQLHKLREILREDTDPVLNDLDSYELVRAGLLSPVDAKLARKPLRLATIDNYQGEESDIVIVSLTRSNAKCDIGFMFAPERLNVLLSRARNALIMLGNATTFKNARKGKELWGDLFDLLGHENHIYQGFPVKCERHPHTKAILSQAVDFDTMCPDGGCIVSCGTLLSCGLHVCPSQCHQLADHSKIPCKEMMPSKCPDGHPQSWMCSKGPPTTCNKCERTKKLAKQKQQEDLAAQARRDAEQKAHLDRMDALNAQIVEAARLQQDARLSQERANAIKQKENNLAFLRASQSASSTHHLPPVSIGHNLSLIDGSNTLNTPVGGQIAPGLAVTDGSVQAAGGQGVTAVLNSSKPSLLSKMWDAVSTINPLAGLQKPVNQHQAAGKPLKKLEQSPSQLEWKRQKNIEGAQNDAIDAIMEMTGLEIVKSQVLGIKAKIDTSIRQNASFKRERFNVVLLGNPGTGKTTIARQYAKFLASVNAIPGNTFVETTGARLAQGSVSSAEKLLEGVIKAGGGAIFIDEAYQLTSGNNPGGPAVLDFLLAEMENNVGTLVFVLAGYNKEMEKFFEHNPGLKSRVPYQFQFADYEDEELMCMFEDMIKKAFQGRMKVESGVSGLYGRMVIRRLGRRRGLPGFGNARDLETVFARIRERQAVRLTKELKEGKQADDFFMTREDFIGPDPSTAVRESKEWTALKELTGLKMVKDSIQSFFDLIEENFQRELCEERPMDLSLNRVFLGSPGTGKTTVAKLYGKILADMGLLSNGEVVVKNPSDFVGAVIGASEANTKAILANTVGKVLIIDEAYMLYGGGTGNDHGYGSNQFKTSVIDTIVAEVQNVPGEDRCVLLLGYKNQMLEMFQNVNPGLSRRFKIEEAFTFENFSDSELLTILELKLTQQDLDATVPAKKIAIGYLTRMRNRPNFGNAGEVENLITQAKMRCVARRTKLPASERTSNIVFQPEDFDPEWDRSAKASADLVKLFADIVGCEDIVKRLQNYLEIVDVCKIRDMDPREQIATNFVFTGPPGTGKTTVARKIGQAFYNMGILASADVIECSASDLVGQYVGQTGPKTKKLFEKALGKVLFVDEAYRLSEGHFAQEAIDELVGLLTHPDFKSRLIVILAGYEKDMNRLMSVNTGLSSRFPDQVVFQNLDADSCLRVIRHELQKKGVQIDGWNSDSFDINVEMKELIRDMSELADWGNARDMVTASKEMVNRALRSLKNADPSMAPTLSGEEASDVLRNMLSERQRRSKVPTNFRRAMRLPEQSFIPDPQPPPSMTTSTSQATSKPPAPPTEVQDSPQPPTPVSPSTRNRGGPGGRARGRGRGGNQRGGGNVPQERAQRQANPQASPQGNAQRDPGVSDAIWRQMGAAKRAANEIERNARNEIKNLEREAEAQKREEQEQKKRVNDLQNGEAAEREASQRAELQRQREEARLKALAARVAKEKAAADLRARKEAERQRQEKEAKAQRKLREMGVCPVGYHWIRMGSVYRCAGGTHIVPVDQLGV
ncbi:hypothetical protein GALMADRAFT_106825 [Galerina marginata CBS 339.88]|uniref:AAA+ ATPase domain-containing protein n=1 Tax=Galerina marginata (strain CBS 339.88) TaxID=685588 RepID=A0A067SD99_GALM3|nr:hypothetical protein GALMADRAFT_106825 [Galerina marginata CBS 339.88]